MVVAFQISFVLFSLRFPSLFSGVIAAGDNLPRVPTFAVDNEQSGEFKFLQPPITEPKVDDFVTSVRLKLTKEKRPALLAQRGDYAKELVRVLDRFVVKDALREKLSSAEDRLWLSDLTAARVIRLLGDLDAVDASEPIAEHLLVGPDTNPTRLAGGPDYPTSWALFQIGDASLPILRKKITSDSAYIRPMASRIAARILGPRAEEELQKWIDAAETEQMRERLRENSGVFRLMTDNARAGNKLVTPEEYRQPLFNAIVPTLTRSSIVRPLGT